MKIKIIYSIGWSASIASSRTLRSEKSQCAILCLNIALRIGIITWRAVITRGSTQGKKIRILLSIIETTRVSII